MAMKRKFEVDAESDATTTRPKQLKLVPFPNYEPDLDSAMSEAEPLYSAHHVRIPSNASTTSSDSSYGVPSPENASYPSFDLYPHPFFRPDGSIDTESHNYAYYSAQQNSTVGLLQPSNNFVHHGSHCSQIPKLRIACAPGLNGTRTMWSFCEQCGAISMVDNND
ncbi:hypothetical protein C8J56DRAFT_927505 [Mycena floridula]|nr:hypothetical protein C8J56DRAFT_927505 [Mycena floridula]